METVHPQLMPHITIFTSGKAETDINMSWKDPPAVLPLRFDFYERKIEIRYIYKIEKAHQQLLLPALQFLQAKEQKLVWI